MHGYIQKFLNLFLTDTRTSESPSTMNYETVLENVRRPQTGKEARRHLVQQLLHGGVEEPLARVQPVNVGVAVLSQLYRGQYSSGHTMVL